MRLDSEHLIEEMARSNEYENACASAPAQWGIAAAFADIEPFRYLSSIYQKKRDILLTP